MEGDDDLRLPKHDNNCEDDASTSDSDSDSSDESDDAQSDEEEKPLAGRRRRRDDEQESFCDDDSTEYSSDSEASTSNSEYEEPYSDEEEDDVDTNILLKGLNDSNARKLTLEAAEQSQKDEKEAVHRIICDPTKTIDGQMRRINFLITKYYRQNNIDDNFRSEVDGFLNHLTTEIGKTILDFKIDTYGSFSNGFGTKDSDVDVSIVKYDQMFQKSDIIGQLNKISEILVGMDINNVVVVGKTPTIKCDKENRVKSAINITYGNSYAVLSTRLLKLYCEWEPERLPQLGVFVKRWAKTCNISDPSRICPSSYAWILMLIHYLQNCSPPVLPCLQKVFQTKKVMQYGHWMGVRVCLTVEESWSLNTQTPAKLFIGFLNYLNDFDHKNKMMQVADLGPLSTENLKIKGDEGVKLLVQDPFIHGPKGILGAINSHGVKNILKVIDRTLNVARNSDFENSEDLFSLCRMEDLEFVEIREEIASESDTDEDDIEEPSTSTECFKSKHAGKIQDDATDKVKERISYRKPESEYIDEGAIEDSIIDESFKKINKLLRGGVASESGKNKMGSSVKKGYVAKEKSRTITILSRNVEEQMNTPALQSIVNDLASLRQISHPEQTLASEGKMDYENVVDQTKDSVGDDNIEAQMNRILRRNLEEKLNNSVMKRSLGSSSLSHGTQPSSSNGKCSSRTDPLSNLIGKVYDERRRSEQFRISANNFISSLQKEVCPEYSNPKKPIFEMIETGFETRESILHITASGRKNTNLGNQASRLDKISRAMHDMSVNNLVIVGSGEQFIETDRNNPLGAEIRIFCNNPKVKRATPFLLNYCRFAPSRLPQLGIFVNEWAKSCGINEAAQGFPSPYAWSLMLIHYLQNCTPPILACPQKEFWSPNQETLGELFLGFLNYLKQFDHKNKVMLVTELGTVSTNIFGLNDPNNMQLLIEDPYFIGSSGTIGAMNTREVQHILKVIDKTLDVFSRKMDFTHPKTFSNLCDFVNLEISNFAHPPPPLPTMQPNFNLQSTSAGCLQKQSGI